MRLSDPVDQGLRKGAVAIVDGLHVSANAGVAAGATDNADGRCSLIEFTPGDLNAAAVEGESPLALKAVPDTCTYAGAAVVADVFMMFIQ